MAANSLWRWRALNTEGEVQTGTLWAIDRGAAYTALVLKQLHPLALKRCQQRHRWQVQHCYDIFRQARHAATGWTHAIPKPAHACGTASFAALAGAAAQSC